MTMKRSLYQILVHAVTIILLSLPCLSYSQDKGFVAQIDSLLERGNDQYQKGDYKGAIVSFQSVKILFEQSGNNLHPDYALSLHNIAKCYSSLGDYEMAINYFHNAASIIEKVYGSMNPYYALCIGGLGKCYRALNNYSSALKCHLQALSVFKDTIGDNNPYYATTLNDIGVCYSSMEYYDTALEYLNQSLSMVEYTLGNEHIEYARTLYNIGECYRGLYDYVKAIEYYKLASPHYDNSYSSIHPFYALCLGRIGSCYRYLGNYDSALESLFKALTIIINNYGENHPYYATTLSEIGLCYMHLADYDNALGYLNNSLSITERTLGKDHHEYASVMNNIGLCYAHLADYSKSIDCFNHSLSIAETTVGNNYSTAINCLINLGFVYSSIGDFDKALEYYQHALSVTEESLGKNHWRFAECLAHIGMSFYNTGDFTKASRFLTSYSETTIPLITSTISQLPEFHRERFWRNHSYFFTDAINAVCVAVETPEVKGTAYDDALFGKGLMLNTEIEMRKLILESGDNEALDMYNSIKESRKRLDLLYQNPLGKKSKIDSLNKDIDSREAELMKRSKALGDYARNLTLKWTDVKAALGKKDIAIEFASYTHQDTTSYIALTIKSDYTEPHLVTLFNSEDLAGIKASQYYKSTDLSSLIWGNLSEELIGVGNVYFSPVGELNNIGIEYLMDEDGEHLVSEKRNYFRLTSTRELVKEYNPKRIANATVYGGIRYDISPDSRRTAEETESERLTMSASRSYIPLDSLSGTRGGWKYLPGSKAEAEAISSTLRSKRIHNDLLEGTHGTEESFKRLSGAKKDVIHIATHGFYWTDTDVARRRMEIYSFMLDKENQAPYEDKALTRSGLLFAGAQNTFEGKEVPLDVEDGILTAKEISRLDLRGTDLVVISACQSGLGEVTGDGVFGLQRGFKKAGVQSLVMSLWEVDDEATRIMMTRFYENLTRGKSKYNSFDEAQSYLRKYERGKFDKPQYYAAFVLLDAIN